jgi:hypothetical protein
MREAYSPQTTCYPCRALPTAHLLQQARVAPSERCGEPPLLPIGPRRAPCLLPSGPPQPSLPALPSGWLDRHRGIEGRAIRQDPCRNKPPPGHEPLARQRDTPSSAVSATAVAKAPLIPRREGPL